MKASSSLPEQFGRYRVQKVLGEGGMGAVYLARDTQLDRDVALKVPQFAGDNVAQLKERFRQEARAAATVQHPNICPIYDVGEIDGVQYITMAFIDGKPLAEWVGGEKSLTERQVAALIRKVASAMNEAHKKGVVHRDLKPSNIMIDRRGEPIVMDFGLARRAGSGDQRLTKSGTIMGSPAYMAPEQVKGDLYAVGPSCDIYSLGVILYELLTHRLPFIGEDNLAVLAQVLMDEPTPPSRIRPDLDAGLEAIFLKALAKKSENRFASMADLAGVLQDYLRGAPRPAETQPPSKTRTAELDETGSPGSKVARTAGADGVAPTNGPIRGIYKNARRPSQRRKRSAGRRLAGVWIASISVIAAIALLGVLGTIVYQLTGRGSIRIEMVGAAENVEMKVDGVAVEPGKSLRLRTGDHDLEVTAPGFQAVKQVFPIHRGDNPVLRVALTKIVESGGGAKPPTQSPGEFVSLFNGMDLSGWTVDGGKPTQWSIKGDAIVGHSPDSRERSYLLTKKEYGDFVLRFEFLAECKSAGIAIRAIEGEKVPMANSMAFDHPLVKLTNPALGAAESTGMTHWLQSAEARNQSAPDLLPAVNGWQSMEVAVRGDRCAVSIGGTRIIDLTLDKTAKSRGSFVPGLGRERGKIGFQINTGTISLRRIEIQELPAVKLDDRPFVPLFNGRDLSGWRYDGKDTGVWRVEDGQERFTVTDPPKQRGWLVTEREYGDFQLRLEFRLWVRANSGVALRWPPNAKKQMEIQIEDDSSLDAAKVKDFEFTGSLYGVGIDRKAELKPLGQWNQMEIDIRGDKLRVEVNGRETLSILLTDARVVRYCGEGTSKSGRIGLQHWISGVQFRNVELREYPANWWLR